MNNQTSTKPVTPESELALVDDMGDFAIVTINRPEKRNAMSPAAMRQLPAPFAQLDDKKVTILTGIGPSFCTGVVAVEERRRLPISSHLAEIRTPSRAHAHCVHSNGARLSVTARR